MAEARSTTQITANRTFPVAGRGLLAAATLAWLGWCKWHVSVPRWHVVLRSHAIIAAELLAIVLWAMVITGPYLNLDPAVIPIGKEWTSGIQTHHLWTRVGECGWCALWNGSTRGGSPAFVDLHGSMLHPLVIFTTLGWGGVNGSKLALVGAFFMAGLAQWWLAYVLGLGWAARVWSATMAVAAGHLAARMELGAFGVVLSTAACALVLPPRGRVAGDHPGAGGRRGARLHAVRAGLHAARRAAAPALGPRAPGPAGAA